MAMKYIYLLNLDRESTINNGTHKLVNSGNDSLVHVIVFCLMLSQTIDVSVMGEHIQNRAVFV